MKKYFNQPLTIEKCSPLWSIFFEKEKQKILNKLKKYIFGIEHIGSTSIPNLAAKPIVDIMIGINSEDTAQKCVQLLEELNYEYVDKPDQYYFRKYIGINSGFHIHMIIKGNKFWNERIKFRDYLRANTKAVQEYSLVKQKLFEQYKDNRNAYREKKAEYIKEIMKKI